MQIKHFSNWIYLHVILDGFTSVFLHSQKVFFLNSQKKITFYNTIIWQQCVAYKLLKNMKWALCIPYNYIMFDYVHSPYSNIVLSFFFIFCLTVYSLNHKFNIILLSHSQLKKKSSQTLYWLFYIFISVGLYGMCIKIVFVCIFCEISF